MRDAVAGSRVVQQTFGHPLGMFEGGTLVTIKSDETIINDLQKQSKHVNNHLKNMEKTWNYAVSRGLVNEEIIVSFNSYFKVFGEPTVTDKSSGTQPITKFRSNSR